MLNREGRSRAIHRDSVFVVDPDVLAENVELQRRVQRYRDLVVSARRILRGQKRRLEQASRGEHPIITCGSTPPFASRNLPGSFNRMWSTDPVAILTCTPVIDWPSFTVTVCGTGDHWQESTN